MCVSELISCKAVTAVKLHNAKSLNGMGRGKSLERIFFFAFKLKQIHGTSFSFF
jgi:hypothetical protein